MRVVSRIAVLGLVAVVVALCSAAVAHATEPSRFEFDFQVSDTIDCSAFNPAWTFNDNFTDFFHVRGEDVFDADGNLLREILHVQHMSNDVNSVTGFTLHEHNNYLVTLDFVAGTITFDGASNIMQRRGVGSVIQNTGHKVSDLQTGEPITVAGPTKATDQDFCAAIA